MAVGFVAGSLALTSAIYSLIPNKVQEKPYESPPGIERFISSNEIQVCKNNQTIYSQPLGGRTK